MEKQRRRKQAFPRKTLENGNPNPKYVDVLEEDKPIANQAYCCLSFISPEKILKQKEMYFFEEFLKQWEINKGMEKYHQFLNFISFKYKIKFEDVMKDFEEFLEEEQENIRKSSVEDDYKNFLDREEEKLEKRFQTKHNFQTCVRGVKVRGNYATQEEAELRCKMAREADPNFEIYVGKVGVWLPWDPEAYKTGRVEYLEEELNQLNHEKIKNDQNAKIAFEQRKKEAKQKAIDENKKNAEKHGAGITQDIDENGNLVGVGNTTTEQHLNQTDSESISVADIRNELFEGDDIVVGKSDYGKSRFANTFEEKKE
jgi:hypothetical protein